VPRNERRQKAVATGDTETVSGAVPTADIRGVREAGWSERAEQEHCREPLEASSLPIWVPEAVSRLAAQLIRDPGPWNRCAVRRLACDPRMRAVWTEIEKSKRSGYKKTSRSFHPPANQGLAIFDQYIQFVRNSSDYLRDIDDTKRVFSYDEDADFLRILTPQQRACVLVFAVGVFAAYPGFRVVTEPEWKIQMGDRPAPQSFVIERRRGDQVQKGMAVGIGSALRNLFGTAFVRTTATLVGVITRTKAPPANRVREWLRHP
jgi:hypothetical protein